MQGKNQKGSDPKQQTGGGSSSGSQQQQQQQQQPPPPPASVGQGSEFGGGGQPGGGGHYGGPPNRLVDGQSFGIHNDPGEDLRISGSIRAALENAPPPSVKDDPAAVWNAVILGCTRAMRFDRYEQYINDVFCSVASPPSSPPRVLPKEETVEMVLRRAADGDNRDSRDPVNFLRSFSTLYAYDLLKVATEAYLAMQCNAFSVFGDPATDTPPPSIAGTVLARNPENTPAAIRQALLDLLSPNRVLPYIDAVAGSLARVAEDTRVSFCEAAPLSRFTPCCIELIWSYWHEEGMLVQAINAVSLRFQNRRSSVGGRDPLAHLELEPLRPLNNLLWGYIQDEQSRLTIARRAYEYQHEYGLTLYGKAVPPLNPADRRSKFVEAFHNLLHTASVYYRDQANRMVVPDAFPLLNALKEVHLILAEGAHNQFGDLPWTARVEMMIQKWLLSRPEIERFLGGRVMVPYPEKWMGIVDQMKTLQGWTDVSVRHFLDLAEWGERLLLSIRWGDWSDNLNIGVLSAENWALIFRDAVQGYIHAYRAVTGVDLAASSNSVRLSADSYTQPSTLLRNRLAAQRRP